MSGKRRTGLCQSLYGIIFFLLLYTPVQTELLENRPVGPDTRYYHDYQEAGPWHIHVLEIDLTNPLVSLESVKAQNQLYGTEQTSAMAESRNYAKHYVVAAVNGDFYQTGGIPVGAQVIDGVLIKNPYPRPVFGMTAHKQPFIDIVSFRGELEAADNTSWPLDGVNKHRDSQELVLYNRYYGQTTNSNFWGTELILKYLTDPCVNDTFLVKVMTKDSVVSEGHGNNKIPPEGAVISGHSAARNFLNKYVFLGDTLKLILRLPPRKGRIKTLIGGVPRLIRAGKATIEYQNEVISRAFCTDRHPRTALGYDQAGEKLFFMVVDGRQEGYSVGMSLYELSEYMLEWNIYHAINLDGGGSSTMIIRNQVVNRPSDEEGERAVGNALMLINRSSRGQLAHLFLKPDQALLKPGEVLDYSYWATDQYFNPIRIEESLLKWKYDPGLGAIEQNGHFKAESTQAEGYIRIHYQHLTDSAWVKIKPIIR